MTAPHTTIAPREADPLDVLIVFDRLVVGPVELTPKRLVAPYRLYTGEKMEQTELIYTYEEVVFDPKSTESQNLAAMIAAQVALNYGLFCREIVFNDWLDKTDRRFLRQMAENTAREIFVKKFVEPNPFLVGDAVGLPPSQAQVIPQGQAGVRIKTESHRPSSLGYRPQTALHFIQRGQGQPAQFWSAG